MIDCQHASFSPQLQVQRISQADELLGQKVVRRLLCFALYLLGVDRNSIAQLLNIPRGTVRSIVRAVLRGGLPALEDRRQRSSSFLPPEQRTLNISARREQQAIHVDLGGTVELQIPTANTLQMRVVLLTMLNSNLLSTAEVAAVVGLSQVHTLNLARRLQAEDVGALIDKREGQKQEYRFTEQVKAELIQQFILDLVAGRRVSGRLLSEHLRDRCSLSLPARSIRDQLGKLGLSRIKKSLPELLARVKKNSNGSS
jgi:hypothetical protein